MRRTKNNNFKKKILVMLILFVVIFSLTKLINAATTEKTTITCQDENMYNALKQALSSKIALGDADNNNRTIKIATDQIPQIKEINLENKQISNISGIENFTGLTTISLANNNITSIEPLRNLNSITALNLNNNNNLGNGISSVLSSKSTIQNLELASTGLSNIDFLANLKALKTLNIANDSYSSLIPIEGLTTITNLNASGNQSLKTIESILKLRNLQILNISNTGVTTLELDSDNEIGIYNLRNLTELYVSGLDVDTVEPIIRTYYDEHAVKNEWGEYEGRDVIFLNKLKTLDISYINRDGNMYMPSFYDLAKLETLEKLYMQGDSLTDVYDLYLLNNLTEVNLKDNNIEDLSGLMHIEQKYSDDGESMYYEVTTLKAKKIDLSNNEIQEVDIFGAAYTVDYVKDNWDDKNPTIKFNDNKFLDVTLLNLSGNHIHYTVPLESISKDALQLYDQVIDMPIYKKDANVDQYILLLEIMQASKKSTSKFYSANATYETVGCTLNNDSNYQEPGLYNVIISKDKTEEDKMSVTLHGGIGDGTVVNFNITDDPIAIDSLMFNDANLVSAIQREFYKQDNVEYLVGQKNILNVNHYGISEVQELDLSNNDISDIKGMENFDSLRILNISGNKNIKTLQPLSYCYQMEELNASGTSVANNISAIEQMRYLKILTLNGVGLTKIDSINNLTQKFLDNEEETVLTDLDLSANNLENINGVEKITTLKKLTATGNKIKQLPDLSKLEQLERLTMYSNQITSIPKISTSKKLKYINFSDNKLSDISELKNLTDVIDLNLSNNILDDDDLDQIKNMTVSQSLMIAGNSISDISTLRTSISKVTKLDVSNNLIQDVSIIDSRIQQNCELKADNQKIALTLSNANQQNEISIDLPQIFTAAKNQSSKFYTVSDFEVKNCTVNGDKLNINLKELGNNIASVKIVNGKADGTTLSVVAPINAEITYSTKDLTKSSVTATIRFTNRDNVTIKNNGGSNQYVFNKNGEFTFEYVDEFGVEDSVTANVTWIDNEKPTITGVEDGKSYSQAVTPVIKDNNQIASITLTKDGNDVSNYTSGSKVSEPGQYVLTAVDTVGNEAKVSFTIKNEEKLTSTEYTVDEQSKLVTEVELETSVSTFKTKISGITNYTIEDKNGKTLTNSDLIPTGAVLRTNVGEYKLVVTGDLNGDGKLNINDLAQAQKIFLELAEPEELKVKAADFKKNGSIDITDLSKLQKMFLGI